MLTYYLILGLSPDADDQAIRRRYLQLIQQYTPEKYPEKFKRITEAYEALKTPRERVRTHLFGFARIKDPEQALRELVNAVELKKRRPGLRELFEAVGNQQQ